MCLSRSLCLAAALCGTYLMSFCHHTMQVSGGGWGGGGGEQYGMWDSGLWGGGR
jgi:hypothetical protein